MTSHVARPWPGEVEWGGDWLEHAATDLARLGFELRDGAMPGTMPGPRLLVGLRDAPTLEHFDPEEVTFWEVHLGRGRLTTLNRSAPMPRTQPFSWGRIQIADRVPVTNQFLSFGGTLLADAADEHRVYAAFVSRSPIVRWAGHSQGVDPLADEIGVFFARLMVPIDFQADAETRVGEAEPEALYAAFLHDAAVRFLMGGRLHEEYP
ncbi:MAG TPA: hypothetical protein VIH37_06270, partial [Candidatus Limnocylindrales bacterium]